MSTWGPGRVTGKQKPATAEASSPAACWGLETYLMNPLPRQGGEKPKKKGPAEGPLWEAYMAFTKLLGEISAIQTFYHLTIVKGQNIGCCRMAKTDYNMSHRDSWIA